ncbi:MAG: hypothetical protein AAF799_23135 [Myxococcota bacterium]
MASTPTTSTFASEQSSSRQSQTLRVKPFQQIDLQPPPSNKNSGLFPAVAVAPTPPNDRALRLRRAVLLTVVVGGLGLLAYASWQRVAHARAGDADVTVRSS